MHKIWKYFESGEVIVCNYCRQWAARKKALLLPNFESEGGGALTGSQFLDGAAGKEGVTFRGRGCSFWIKNKLKSEIFNDKKVLQTKIFFSVITKNLNWEIFKNNLLTFKRWDDDEKFLTWGFTEISDF